ncbi:uncharacterized protein LOC144114398 [Amblyomma americanum]
MRFAQNPFSFIVQVRKQYGECFCSSDPCLIVLPCPRLLSFVFCMTSCLRKLLLLGGDIETNPGPDMAQIAKQLKEIASDIKDIKENKLDDIEKKLDALTRLENSVASFHQQLANMDCVIKKLEKKIDDLNNRSRRSNLIIYGLPENDGETNDSLESTVNKEIIQDTLELDPVAIERIHRFGRPGPDKTRPVIFKLLDTRQKSAILKNCHKLKETEYSIGEDFSLKIRELRKKLWEKAKPHRDKREKVSMAFDKLYINSRIFVWDDEINDIVPFKKTTI